MTTASLGGLQTRRGRIYHTKSPRMFIISTLWRVRRLVKILHTPFHSESIALHPDQLLFFLLNNRQPLFIFYYIHIFCKINYANEFIICCLFYLPYRHSNVILLFQILIHMSNTEKQCNA